MLVDNLVLHMLWVNRTGWMRSSFSIHCLVMFSRPAKFDSSNLHG